MFLDSLWGFLFALGKCILAAVAVWRIIAQFDKTWNEPIRKAFSNQLDAYRTATPENNWAQQFADLFDRVFTPRHWSLRCFARSSLLSIISCGFVLALWAVLRPTEFWAFALQVDVVDAVVLAAFLALVNVVPDYLSLLQTRLFLTAATRRPGLMSFGAFLIVDAAATTLVAAGAFIAVFQLGLIGYIVNFVGTLVAGTALMTGFAATMFAAFVLALAVSMACMYINLFRVRDGCAPYLLIFIPAYAGLIYLGTPLGVSAAEWLLGAIGLEQYATAYLGAVDQLAGYVGLSGTLGFWVVMMTATLVAWIAVMVTTLLVVAVRKDIDPSGGLLGNVHTLLLAAFVGGVGCVIFAPSFGSNVLPVQWSASPLLDAQVQPLLSRFVDGVALRSEQPGLITTGVFIYSTFLTSVWMWLLIVGATVVRLWLTLHKGPRKLFGLLDVEENPFGSIGFAIGCLIIAGWFGVTVVTWVLG